MPIMLAGALRKAVRQRERPIRSTTSAIKEVGVPAVSGRSLGHTVATWTPRRPGDSDIHGPGGWRGGAPHRQPKPGNRPRWPDGKIPRLPVGPRRRTRRSSCCLEPAEKP
jgi:hypothetical protein